MYLAAVSSLVGWDNFYVIIGSSAAALIGLMFVAMTLIAGEPNRRSNQSTSAFSTPTIIHFSAILTIAALSSAPWPALWMVSLLFGLVGLGGVIYTGVVIWRLRQLIDYQPVVEDWVWNGIVPFVSYTALVVAAGLLVGHAVLSLFIVGALTLLLLFTGIHNAWDIVTFLAITLPIQRNGQPDKAAPTARDESSLPEK